MPDRRHPSEYCGNGRGAADVAACPPRRPRAILRRVPLVKRNATYDDLCALPDHMVAEIIDGDLFASPRPASPHALASSMLGAAVIGSFGDEPRWGDLPGGWWILFEPELHFRRDVLVPDRAGWRRERVPTVPDVAGFELAPDWACEVISPSTGEIDRGRKMRVYARERVGHLWIVDPILRTLEATGSRTGAGSWRAPRPGPSRSAPIPSRRSRSTCAAGGASSSRASSAPAPPGTQACGRGHQFRGQPLDLRPDRLGAPEAPEIAHLNDTRPRVRPE